MPEDSYNLQRFVDAQNPVYVQVCAELIAGKKHTDWMWFIFPQRIGLGQSLMSVKYAISSQKEAHTYLAHPILGMRLRQCTRYVLAWLINGRSVEQIFGYPDDLKFKSSMTLFASVAPDEQLFEEALSYSTSPGTTP